MVRRPPAGSPPCGASREERDALRSELRRTDGLIAHHARRLESLERSLAGSPPPSVAAAPSPHSASATVATARSHDTHAAPGASGGAPDRPAPPPDVGAAGGCAWDDALRRERDDALRRERDDALRRERDDALRREREREALLWTQRLDDAERAATRLRSELVAAEAELRAERARSAELEAELRSARRQRSPPPHDATAPPAPAAAAGGRGEGDELAAAVAALRAQQP
eukprot:gene48605-8557_t